MIDILCFIVLFGTVITTPLALIYIRTWKRVNGIKEELKKDMERW